MVGFTEPNRYEPRSRWRETLAQWVQSPPADEESWQHQISVYWRWRTLDGLSLREAWEELGMEPATARAAKPKAIASDIYKADEYTSKLAERSEQAAAQTV